MSKPFSIYRSSAGSGKTRTLAKQYLKLALGHNADYFKHILAVTFTNKSTQEMKDRILKYLDEFSNDRAQDLAKELQKELGLDAQTFKQHAEAMRSVILHKYSQFSISTIDAFFQRVIRAFTREAGLSGDYRLEVEQEEVVDEVINNLMEELGSKKELTEWVVGIAQQNVANNVSWDVRPGLREFSKEIFKEEFRLVENEVAAVAKQPDFFINLKHILTAERHQFLAAIKKRAARAVAIIQNEGWTNDDFKYGKVGAFSFMLKLSNLKQVVEVDQEGIGKRPLNEYQSSSNWPATKTAHKARMEQVAAEQLIPLLLEILDIHQKGYVRALSAEIVLSNLNEFGLIADIAQKLKEYKQENNMMLLSDAPYFLNSVIDGSDTPFVYEKVGSFYKNFLIDEFQDTSGLQWKNFKPLIVNSLDAGYSSMIVGDVKQAIYRWRSGDLFLLQSGVNTEIGESRIEPYVLDKNYRSSRQIVAFNNAVFQAAAQLAQKDIGAAVIPEVYKDVVQGTDKKQEGFVEVAFLGGNENEEWKEIALQHIPLFLERLQALKINLKDIAILVRTNDDGQQIVQHLVEFKHTGKSKEGFRYDVVSNESLRLDGSGVVNFLITALKYLHNPDDHIACAQLSYEYARFNHALTDLHQVFTVSNQTLIESHLPDSFTRYKARLKKLPLLELTETLIEIFDLGKLTGELEYLQTLQNEILNFSNRERNDMGAFLDWWEDVGHKKSIQLSGDVDAAQIITVHKSKGLQFKYVLVPFCSWELDHGSKRPMMWVKSDQKPFDGAGVLPVNYSSKLTETFFKDAYEEERKRCYLDNLNLLYVALTRAEHGLIVTAPAPGKKKKLNNVGTLLHEIVQQPALATGWRAPEQVWRAGEWTNDREEQNSSVASLSLKKYVSASWANKLVIRHHSAGHFQLDESETTTRIKYGIHLHTIFSRIRYKDDLNETFQMLQQSGIMNEQEKPVIRQLVDELLANETVASWFDKDWEVRTEVPVLLPGGKESRMDRLMLKGRQAVVVDFKTGTPTNADLHQVNGYLDTLRKMNFHPVKGYLLYIRTGEVVQVPPDKPAKSAKQNKDQLGLEF
ncbi:MAG: hypothetical protein DYG99_08035 [Bacteroidetes bacterium CHB5]|nr:hypothetical protein [Bacteroidetes bacterium CHB5]